MNCLRFAAFLSLLTVFSLPFSLFAQEESEEAEPALSDAERAELAKETVARAREYMGGSDKLDAIKSIHLQGVLVYGSGQSGTIDSVFQKPSHHQVVTTMGAVKETSTLNKSEAWRKAEDLRSPGAFELSFYDVDEVRHLQATVLDALSFFETPPTRKGRIEYLGTGDVNGEPAEVMYYLHTDRIWFRKYFDPETGRLMHMVNDKGVVYSYEGEKLVDGVRFPEKVVVRIITQFGEQTMEVSYSSITLNEEFDLERFRVPVSYND